MTSFCHVKTQNGGTIKKNGNEFVIPNTTETLRRRRPVHIVLIYARNLLTVSYYMDVHHCTHCGAAVKYCCFYACNNNKNNNNDNNVRVQIHDIILYSNIFF